MSPIIADVELTKDIALALADRTGNALEGVFISVAQQGMSIPTMVLCDAVQAMSQVHFMDRGSVKNLFIHMLEEPWICVEGLTKEQMRAAISIWSENSCLLSEAILMARAASGEVVWSRNADVCQYYSNMMEETGCINYAYLHGEPEHDNPRGFEQH